MLSSRFLVILFSVMGSILATEDESSLSIQNEPLEKRYSEGMIASDFSKIATAILSKKFVDQLIAANSGNGITNEGAKRELNVAMNAVHPLRSVFQSPNSLKQEKVQRHQ